MPPTVAIIAAGAMGAAVARRLTTAGCTVLTNLDGRSPATRQRARDAGMTDVPFSDIPHRAALTLSILPPSEAHALAARWLAAWGADDEKPGSRRGEERRTGTGTGTVYVDCNAVSPQTVKDIAGLFTGSGVGFVDAGIIGGPPREGYDPTFYASATGEDRGALDAFEALRAGGLKITCLEGEGVGVGDASALKM
ncbi:hypothetical protein OF83DRAFT_1070020, partial [Amylostereum chailletii]